MFGLIIAGVATANPANTNNYLIHCTMDETKNVVEAPTQKPMSKYAAKKAARVANAANPEKKDVISSEEVIDNSKPTTKVGKQGRDIGIHVPEHIMELAYIVKDNAAIRRYTSLNILNYLVQTGRMRQDAGGKYVNFMWNKFCVTADGLKTEYSYREPFFLNALVASFGQFAKGAQDTIQSFMVKEGLDVILDGKATKAE